MELAALQVLHGQAGALLVAKVDEGAVPVRQQTDTGDGAVSVTRDRQMSQVTGGCLRSHGSVTGHKYWNQSELLRVTRGLSQVTCDFKGDRSHETV